MSTSLHTQPVWSVLVEQIQDEKLISLPFAEMTSPKLGDFVCFESMEQMPVEGSLPYAYVKVIGVFKYYVKGSDRPVNGLKLIVFSLVESLGDIELS